MEERRGRPKELPIVEGPRKFTRIYESEDSTETWTYNLDKSNGPISVDIKYKNGVDKKWMKMQKENTRQKSEMRKITKIQSQKLQTKKRKSSK
jgi:hypothetical protein